MSENENGGKKSELLTNLEGMWYDLLRGFLFLGGKIKELALKLWKAFLKLWKDAFKAPKKDSEKARLRRERARKKLGLIALVFVVLLALILLLSLGGKDDVVNETPVETLPEQAEVEVTEEQESETETVTAPEEETSAEESGYVPSGNYLPVLSAGSNDKKVIAITVDVVGEGDSITEIVESAAAAEADLTIFPLGQSVLASETLQTALRRAYYSYGFEIENRTYDNGGLYSMTAEQMAQSISLAQLAVSKALGTDYEMHFLRTNNGYGENDLRTHQYLEQLGTYKGIALWTVDGSETSLKKLKSGLKAGYIYRFGCTSADYDKLMAFIAYAKEEGYELVTLNQLTGCEANATSPIAEEDIMQRTIVAPAPFTYTQYVTLGSKDYTRLYAVQLLQQRLKDLGYLDSDAAVDGCYGSDTKTAVKYFQYAAGLTVDGYAGVETQITLFSDSAPKYGTMG